MNVRAFHSHALRLRLDGLLGFKLDGRIGLILLVAEICADGVSVAKRAIFLNTNLL
jgi:hypothetical protein